MNASKEMLWNIPFGMAVYALGLVALVVVAYALYRRYRVWRRGQPENRLYPLARRAWSFAGLAITDGLLHRRLLRQPYSGVMHLLIFGGAGVLLVGTVLDPLSHYFFHFLHGRLYLWVSLALDVAGVFILAGVVMAFLRRYVEKPDRLDRVTDDAVVLCLIAAMVFTGFLVEGLRIAETELAAHPGWAVWSPVGYLVGRGIAGLPEAVVLGLHRGLWWGHVGLFVGGAVYVAATFSKLNHIIVGPVNAFLRSMGPRGVPARIDIMNAEHFGVSKIQDLNWKHLLDLDACTRCGRCQDNCPAYLTGKPLSPKKLVQDLKRHMAQAEPGLFRPGAPANSTPAPETGGGKSLIGDVVTEDEIWSCTTCGACEEKCPMFIEHPDKVIAMRRNLVLEQARVPKTAQAALVNTQQRGHPWKGTALSRTSWMEGVDVPRAVEGGEPGVLFWVGCTGALVERNIKVTAAVARLLTMAGVKFSVLAEAESCCGHFARRLGDEYLFQMLVEKNIELLKAHNVRTIVTACPHCYHTLKNEYPQFGARFRVLHHTEFLLGLVRGGKLRLNGHSQGTVTYQDPCYLGRYNGLYRAPRRLLKEMKGLKVKEMGRARSSSVCCGAGGGRMWFEEPVEQRVNQYRASEAAQTGAGVVATGCPLCLQMFEDAVKALGKEESLRAMDVAEMVLACVAAPGGEAAPAAGEGAGEERVTPLAGAPAR